MHQIIQFIPTVIPLSIHIRYLYDKETKTKLKAMINNKNGTRLS